MRIRIQVTGGLGNQLFIWSGAHYFHAKFGAPVELIFIDDKNSRLDRRLELERISQFCKHPISIHFSKSLGLLLRGIDKFNLENKRLSRHFLQRIGIYSFANPLADMAFDRGKPRFVRCYFQETELVDLAWESWSAEFFKSLESTNLNHLALPTNFNAVHVRRGDSLNFASTFGVLDDSYFESQDHSGHSNYVCTDEQNLPESLLSILKPFRLLTLADSSAWETLKLFCEAEGFKGVNSTLSWWAAYSRIRQKKFKTSLPKPWTRQELGYDRALFIDGVKYLSSRFTNVS